MKTFVGRIVTVPDGAGWSVTVSKWGVAQSSRHRGASWAENGAPFILCFHSYLITYGACKKLSMVDIYLKNHYVEQYVCKM
jgi:hypothetical protein